MIQMLVLNRVSNRFFFFFSVLLSIIDQDLTTTIRSLGLLFILGGISLH